MTARELLQHFDDVKRSGEGWVCRCKGPLHEHGDRRRSLSVKEVGNRILLHCFVGCENEQIMAAIGLTMPDLFLEPLAPRDGGEPKKRPASGKGQIVEAYDYTDVAGTLLYQNVRYEPKDFKQRRPDGQGGWKWTLGDVPHVLYRLPDLAEQRRVYLVEGEKDVNNLWAIGLPATTSAGGAKSWREEYAGQLKDAGVEEVIILPDNDPPGAGYAAQAAASITAVGIKAHTIKLPGLAERGDVSDWLQAGHQVRELEQLVSAAIAASLPAPFGIGLGTFLGYDDPEIEPYIEGVLSSDGGGWIGGEEKLGKSFWAADEALCLALGLKVAGKFNVPVRRRVLFIEEEDSPRRMRNRLRALLRGRGFDPGDAVIRTELDQWFHLEVWSGFKFDNPKMMQRLEQEIADFRPAVIYIDVLRKVTLKDITKADQASMLLDMLDELRRRYNVVFRILHHYRKSQGFRVGRGSQEIGGSFVLGAWAENSLFFEPQGRKQGAAVKVDIQMKDGAPEPAFILKMTAQGPRHAPTSMVLTAEEISEKAPAEEFRDQVIAALDDLPKTEAKVGQPGVSIPSLMAALKRSETTIRRTIKDLIKKGVVDVVGTIGKKADVYALVKK